MKWIVLVAKNLTRQKVFILFLSLLQGSDTYLTDFLRIITVRRLIVHRIV